MRDRRAGALHDGGRRCVRRNARRTGGAAMPYCRRCAPPPDEGRRYRPHVTLARCRAPVDVRPIVAELSGYQGPPWTAEEIYLIRSTPGGSTRYETLGSWKLRPRTG